jgi:cell division protein FtsQ
VSTPPSDDGKAAPKPRRAATERAMRRRERRIGTLATDRPAATDRTTREPSTRERPAYQRPQRERRRVLARRWGALAVLLGLTGLVVVMLWTPVLGVRSVDVVGVRDLTTEQVVAAAEVRPGTPMLRLDTLGITARVALLPRVAAVDVSRDWPSTVRITITERDPVGVIAAADGMHLVDSTGLDYATVPTAPADLPKIQIPAASPTDPRTQAVVRVLSALPTQLRAQTIAISANTPGSVTLALADGKTIRWGDAANSARKAAVLAALMTRPGQIYDVSSPDLPTISGQAVR